MVIRRKIVVAAVLTFLCLGSTGVWTAEPGLPAGSLPLKAKMTTQFTGGLFGLYLSADPSVVWKPGRFAVGVGAELIIGLNQFDIYALPYLRAEAGWMHLDLGYSLALASPAVGSGLAGLSAGLAFSPEPFEVGYGRLGFDLGLDFSIPVFVDGYRVLAGASAVERIIVSAALAGRIGLGVTYSFTLL